jgi:hypothetical protein
MASDRSPEPPIKLVFLRSEFARSNGGFGFRSIRPLRHADVTIKSWPLRCMTPWIDALRCMRLVPPIRHLHLSAAYAPVYIGINGSLSHPCSENRRAAPGRCSWRTDSIEKTSLQFGIVAPVLRSHRLVPLGGHRHGATCVPVRRTTPVNRPFGPCVDTHLALCRPSR